MNDLDKLLEWLKCHYPFPVTTSLMSLSVGIIGDKTINSHEAESRGSKAMQSVIGKNFHEISLKRSTHITEIIYYGFLMGRSLP